MRSTRIVARTHLLVLLSFMTMPAHAAGVDGSKLSAWLGLPFAGLLLSIALFPLLAPKVWHHHYGKIALAWAVGLLLPFALMFGWGEALASTWHVILGEYLPFIILIGTLFVISGGIYIQGSLHGSPALNTGILALGTVLASLMGTTGASMLLIRPLIRANDNRRHRVHTIVFFIFLVSNMGGALTPLGDPPLFLGFLKGVDFTWTLRWMWQPMLLMSVALLVIYYLLDRYYFSQPDEYDRADPTPDSRVAVIGRRNLLLLGCVIALVLMSGTWKPGVEYRLLGETLPLQSLVRDAGLLVLAGLSLAITPGKAHAGNEFSWGPVLEVAKLFAAIFVTMFPVLAILRAAEGGEFAIIARLVSAPDGSPIPWTYFWLSGGLSSFLDNAPTYLVFFNLAGGNPQALMTTHALTLLAISAGSVFMGANTYIGNAPNFMVKAIAEDRGIKMPTFFGYMLWSVGILIPLFTLLTWVFFI
jgi:Na+/H+ antiporter NhaD/arsenite permease-like protein